MKPDVLADDAGGSDGLAENDRHRLLASERRRIALSAVEDLGVPVGLAGLAEEVVTRERGGRPPDQAAIQRVEVTLHHLHLPIMADLGVVYYEPYTRRVEAVESRVQGVE